MKFRTLGQKLEAFNVRCREELHERLMNENGDAARVVPNDELFNFHSTRVMMNELVR